MKKLIIVLLVVGVLGAVGYGAGKSLKSGKLDLGKQTSLLESLSQDKEESFLGSIEDLMTGGKTLKCTYDMPDEADGKGVIYSTKDKMRNEMEFTAEDEGKMKTYTIVNGDWMYIWSNMAPGGTKINISDMKDVEGTVKDSKTAKEMRKQMNYKCRPWIVDNSKFAPPADIEFKDATVMMEGFKDMMTDDFDLDEMMEEAEKDAEDAREWLCKMCETAPDEETKAECRADAECD